MRLAKRTYSLPPDLLARFEQRLAPGERSSEMAKLIGAWLAERERAELRALVTEGCLEMTETYQDVEREWAAAADEAWRGFEQ